jgi:(1->4)-alpha-D-glucan 1-alpha-D-glucosylmutase
MDPLDALLAQTFATVGQRRAQPEATYRLQFHAGFTFRDATAIVPYLRDLGVTHCYASPYLKARPGSQHGYDIVDHAVLNPEIGSDQDYQDWVAALHGHGLGQVFDMVPNHMGVIGNENRWWNDVLENGPSSPYAGVFDIEWHSSPRPALQNRVLLPVLGEAYGKALESQQIRLGYEGGTFTLNYFEHRFPVSPRTVEQVLAYRVEDLGKELGADSAPFMEYQSILTAIRHLPARTETEAARVAERQRETEVIKRRLATLEAGCALVREFIRRNVTVFNGTPGDPHSFDLLDRLLSQQAYRLAYWRVAADEINYRRFFDVNELAALSMEKQEVFRGAHALVLRLLQAGQIDGLRMDHPDGLYDPRQYLERLQHAYVAACARGLVESEAQYRGLEWQQVEGALLEKIAQNTGGGPPPLYVVVEKILGRDEALPADWPVYGTSGYDYLNLLNGLFVDAGNAKTFTRLYDEWVGGHVSFAEVVYQKKFLIMQVSLSSELQMLAHQLDRLAQKDRASRDFTLTSLRHALREIIACFPVYRSYITSTGVHPTDRLYVQTAVGRAKRRNPAISASLFDFVRDMLLLKYPESATEADRAQQVRFVGKFQQVTAPVMAKGLEDTAFYVYDRLLSLNEVGGDPDRFGVPPAALHRAFQERQARWPWALSASSTHDTKRSEDVRARLNALSELPQEWQENLALWSTVNEPLAVVLEDERVPDPNVEYFFYQTLLGAWPLEPYTEADYEQFIARIQAYMSKAMHEAKVHTSWINPNPAYDDAIEQFIARVLDPAANADFLNVFRPFQRRLSHYGLFNSLSQTLVKVAAPGVPDFYQGTELWDLSLVDPDNRRPVDYERRRVLLRELLAARPPGPERATWARQLTALKEDGRVKLYLIHHALQCRQAHRGLFAKGDYLPLAAAGAAADHVFAFARGQGPVRAVVAVPRLITRLMPRAGLPLGKPVWSNTTLILPGIPPGQRFRNVFTEEALTTSPHPDGSTLPLSEAFANFPVALLLTAS